MKAELHGGEGTNSIDETLMLAYLAKKTHDSLRRGPFTCSLECDFRGYVTDLGFGDRIATNGLLLRSLSPGQSLRHAVLTFSEAIIPAKEYPPDRVLPEPPRILHLIAVAYYHIGIPTYFCVPTIAKDSNLASLRWSCVRLGLPSDVQYESFPESIAGFTECKDELAPTRNRRIGHFGNAGDSLSADFSTRHLSETFLSKYRAEMSYVNAILQGDHSTYPVEIREQTCASDKKLGEYFGLDVGPFVKLAFYAAKRGNLHSIFVVREISDPQTRALVNWWYITFDQMAQFASWIFQQGGANMLGGRSAVVRIPKAEFASLDQRALASL